MSAQPPGSPPPGFFVPQPPALLPETRSEVQDSVPQDAPYAAVAPAPFEVPRWSGKRTAAIVAAALALTSAGAIAAAAASPNGIAAPSDHHFGRGFGPGGPGHQFGPGGPGAQQQPAPGQRGFGPGQGRPGP